MHYLALISRKRNAVSLELEGAIDVEEEAKKQTIQLKWKRGIE